MFYSTNHRLNRRLRCWITVSIFWLSSCHIAGAKCQYRRFISRQKKYNWNSNKNVEVQIQEIHSKPGRYYQIGGAIWKPGGTIWSWVQLAPPDYLGWSGTVEPCLIFKNYKWCLLTFISTRKMFSFWTLLYHVWEIDFWDLNSTWLGHIPC